MPEAMLGADRQVDGYVDVLDSHHRHHRHHLLGPHQAVMGRHFDHRQPHQVGPRAGHLAHLRHRGPRDTGASVGRPWIEIERQDQRQAGRALARSKRGKEARAQQPAVEPGQAGGAQDLQAGRRRDGCLSHRRPRPLRPTRHHSNPSRTCRPSRLAVVGRDLP